MKYCSKLYIHESYGENKIQAWAQDPDDHSKPEVLSRIEQIIAVLTKPKPVWRDNNSCSIGS